MYRLLLVDDEAEVVEYFYRLLTEQSQLPLEVFTAGSALEALTCLNQIRIDIVLSDIKMPKMNGLQMYSIIQKRWPRCNIIFLSGVLEFDYVYESIQKRNVRYLTKLEPIQKILNTIQEVIDEIEEEYQQKIDSEKVQKQLARALPILQSQYLSRILNGERIAKTEMEQRFSELNIPLSTDNPIWMVGGIFNHLPYIQEELVAQKNMLEINAVAERYLNEFFHVACYFSPHQYFIWMLQPIVTKNTQESLSPQALLNGQLEYIQSACQKSLELSVSFVYLNTCISLADARNGFIGVKAAFGKKHSLGEKSVIFSCEELSSKNLLIEEKQNLDSDKLLYLDQLSGYLELGQKEEFFALFSSITNPLRQIHSKNNTAALEIYYSLATLLMRTINTYQLTEAMAFHLGIHKLFRLDSHKNWSEAVDFLYQIANAIFSIQFEHADRSASDAVLYVQKYIRENLEQDLTLITLSELVDLNPSYFSRLFKERTDINLYDYITQMRVAKAKELLRSTTKKIQDIASCIGYDSAQSFTRVFRRMAGQSPSQYREEI